MNGIVKYRQGFALVQALITVMIVISIAMIGMKLTFSGRLAQARAVKRDTSRAILEGARVQVFACLQSLPPDPSPNPDSGSSCELTPEQSSCLPETAGGLPLTVELVPNVANDSCVLKLSVDK